MSSARILDQCDHLRGLDQFGPVALVNLHSTTANPPLKRGPAGGAGYLTDEPDRLTDRAQFAVSACDLEGVDLLSVVLRAAFPALCTAARYALWCA